MTRKQKRLSVIAGAGAFLALAASLTFYALGQKASYFYMPADLKATGLAARGWAWTAYDWDEARLFNYIGDAQNTFPIWNATPLVALDVYEHAYFLDYQTDRASYIDAFLENLDWDVVNGWISTYGIVAA